MKTSLYSRHLALGGRMVGFAGWRMPIQYASQLAEHHAVRQDAGMFDVSHMLALDVEGAGATDFLRKLLANDVARLSDHGKALYSCMCNPGGGVVDDLIVYRLADDRYRMVLNAGCAEKDLEWLETHGVGFSINLTSRRDLSMIAVQGPNARAKALEVLPADFRHASEALKPFHAAEFGDWLIARTGYTGEDGFEVTLPNDAAESLWQALLDVAVAPCGLGARDTLRLEAGMNLYGQDMDEETSPLAAGLAWTIAWQPEDRQFIGRPALEEQRQLGDNPRFVGVLLEGRGVLRNHLPLFVGDQPIGEITSGGFSPTLNRAIGLARVGDPAAQACEVEIRGKRLAVRLAPPPFVRNGKPRIDL